MMKKNSFRMPMTTLQRGGYNLVSLAITSVLAIFLITIVTNAYLSGNWIVVKWVAGIWVLLIIAFLIYGSIDDRVYTKKVNSLYVDLQRYIDLSQNCESSADFQEAESRVLNNENFPTKFREGVDDLLERYTNAHPDMQDQVRLVLLRSIHFSQKAFEVLLKSPVNDAKTCNYLEGWMGCRRDDLAEVLPVFQNKFADKNRFDDEFLAKIVLWILPHYPSAENAVLLKPLFHHLEKFREDVFNNDQRELLDRYIFAANQNSDS
jgi:hypothetical protein